MTHAVVGVGLGTLFTSRKMRLVFWLTTVSLTMLPDLDVWAFRLGIPYEAPFGHRGITHSLLFALVAGCAAGLLLRRRLGGSWLDLSAFFFVATASHGFLDAFTNGGRGVGFFLPFDTTRYFMPWTPIQVSDIGLAFFGPRGWATLRSEIIWVWLPTVAVVGAVVTGRRLVRGGRSD
jgi:inner membrane protein